MLLYNSSTIMSAFTTNIYDDWCFFPVDYKGDIFEGKKITMIESLATSKY